MGIHACHKTRCVVQDLLHDVRGEVGVSSSSVASGHHLDHGHDFTGEADLGEAHALGQRPHLRLVLWEQEGVLQHHGQTGDAVVKHFLQQPGAAVNAIIVVMIAITSPSSS